MDKHDEAVLDRIRQAFFGTPRPSQFTSRHCEECLEHDETLRSHTPDTISLAEVGNPGWDPICFATPEAYLYYFPGLARLALQGRDSSSYLFQLAFQLDDRRITSFSDEQCEAVLELLEHIEVTRAEELAHMPDNWQILRRRIRKVRANMALNATVGRGRPPAR